MPLLFSYGTLQLAHVQRAIFGRELEGQKDALLGFYREMVEITDPDVLAKSGERFHPIISRSGDMSHTIEGTVFELSEAELLAADEYEVDDYKRESVDLASGRIAWLYVAQSDMA